MKKLLRLFILILIASSCFSSVTSAQTEDFSVQETNKFDDDKIDDSTNTNALITTNEATKTKTSASFLRNIYGAQFAQDGNKITLSFNLTNKIPEATPLKYAVALIESSSTGESIIRDKFIYDEIINITDRGTPVFREVTYTVPEGLYGDFLLSFLLTRDDGSLFSVSSVGKVSFLEQIQNELQTNQVLTTIEPEQNAVQDNSHRTLVMSLVGFFIILFLGFFFFLGRNKKNTIITILFFGIISSSFLFSTRAEAYSFSFQIRQDSTPWPTNCFDFANCFTFPEYDGPSLGTANVTINKTTFYPGETIEITSSIQSHARGGYYEDFSLSCDWESGTYELRGWPSGTEIIDRINRIGGATTYGPCVSTMYNGRDVSGEIGGFFTPVREFYPGHWYTTIGARGPAFFNLGKKTGKAPLIPGDYTFWFDGVAGYPNGYALYTVPFTVTAAPPTYSCTSSIPANASMYLNDDLNLTANTPYSYWANDTGTRCQFYCNSGYAWNSSSKTCNVVALALVTPTSITAKTTSRCGGYINISWGSVSGIGRYELYRDGSFLRNIDFRETNYRDKPGGKISTSHAYKVRAWNSNGYSSFTTEVSAKQSRKCNHSSSTPTPTPTADQPITTGTTTPVTPSPVGCFLNTTTGIQIKAVANRVSGVGPLSVVFDATQTTQPAANLSRPFHDLNYIWDFGDERGQTWRYGSNPAQSRNNATGAVAGHIFDNAGTYNVKLVVTDGLTTTVSDTCQINVESPDMFAGYAGDKTACIANSLPVAGQDGCPAGAVVYESNNSTAPLINYAIKLMLDNGARRILLKKGDTFLSDYHIQANETGPVTISSYGFATVQPLIEMPVANSYLFNLTNAPTDWRFIDLAFSGTDPSLNVIFSSYFGSNLSDYILYYKLSLINSAGINMGKTNIAVVDNDFGEAIGTPSLGGLGAENIFHFFVAGNRVTDRTLGEHGFRLQGGAHGAVTNNEFYNSAPTKQVFTLRGHDGTDGHGNSDPIPAYTTEYIVVSDNIFAWTKPTGDNWLTSIAPQNTTRKEEIKDILVERNIFSSATNSQMGLMISANDVTVRNNLFDLNHLNSGPNIFYDNTVGLSHPSHIDIFNNSFMSLNTLGFSAVTFSDPQATSIRIANNLAYAPNATRTSANNGIGGSFLYNTFSIDGLLVSNNSTDAQLKNDPKFADTNNLLSIDSWKLATGSYAIHSGTTMLGDKSILPSILYDMRGTQRQDGAIVLGAHQNLMSP